MEKFQSFRGRGLTGLTNCGNTCYLNSCMQVFSHMYELSTFLNEGTYHKRLTKTADSVLLTQWDSLRALMWKTNCTIAPNAFVKAVQKVAQSKGCAIFTGFAQNDVQEFLLFVIDCFHNALSREVVMEVTGSTVSDKDILAKTCYQMMQKTYTKDYSEMIGIFFGIQVSEIKSKLGEALSVTPEPFSVLSVPVMSTQTTDLLSCMREYCTVEKLEGDNAYLNERTGKKEDVTKELGFWSLPQILIIDLKRWNVGGRKNQALVTFPLENLDMSPFVKGYNRDSYKYDLFGVCVHSGTAMGGHYTASIKTADDVWYSFNDTRVTPMPSNAVITPGAYCLFYRKIK